MGDLLRARVAPGSEPKLDAWLATGGDGPAFELAFAHEGRAVSLALQAIPHGDHLAVLGRVMSDHTTRAVLRLNESLAEVVELNRTIRRQRDELTQHHARLAQASTELDESHQGVRSLHAELQSSMEQSRHEGEVKTRLVTNLSHELRTPLHSILGLTQLLQADPEHNLTEEQQKQLRFIRSSASDLLQLVNDMLDLGRLQTGHRMLRLETFPLGELVSSLRGALVPLAPPGGPVELCVEAPTPEQAAVELKTDRTKLSRIVRNLVSNALRFTERGRVGVTVAVEGESLRLSVEDTGIGIEPADQARIFDEFEQIPGKLQSQSQGAGLGLAISRELAEQLGGRLSVESERGAGSTFTACLPVCHEQLAEVEQMVDRAEQQLPNARSVLVVEDDPQTLFLYEKYLVMGGYHVMPARSIEQAQRWIKQNRPIAIVLDIMLEGDSSWNFLSQLKRDPDTASIPVLVATVTNRGAKARALGADEFWLKPIDQGRLLRKLDEVTNASVRRQTRVLVIDDDERSRYLIGKHLEDSDTDLHEAADGATGVELAQRHLPDIILLDFLLEESTAFDVIDDLKSDPRTRPIPVIVITSHVMDTDERRRLLEQAEEVISKQHLSRELALSRIRDVLAQVQRHQRGA